MLFAFTMQRVSEYPVVGPRPENGEVLDDTAFTGGHRRIFVAAKRLKRTAQFAGQLQQGGISRHLALFQASSAAVTLIMWSL